VIDRRRFMMVIAGFFVRSLAADAQSQGKSPKIGLLLVGTLETDASRHAAAFREGLRELGWVEGQNILLEYRYAPGNLFRARQRDDLVPLAVELAQQKVDAVVAFGTMASLAAREATTTIPIVMAAAQNPVGSGLVANLARPGGNVTGVTLDVLDQDLDAKRLQLVKEALPKVSRVAVSYTLGNEDSPDHQRQISRMEAVAPALGIELRSVAIGAAVEDLERTFVALRRSRVGAFRIQSDPVSDQWSGRIAELAIKHHLPTMFDLRTYVEAGGLMSYAPSLAEVHRRAAAYVDKILKGAKPGDLPVEQPTKFELVINLKTAKALGLTIPQSVLLRADEVIQ
jgi:ABC-type uncharacterized transport system substrate-binding protein